MAKIIVQLRRNSTIKREKKANMRLKLMKLLAFRTSAYGRYDMTPEDMNTERKGPIDINNYLLL